MTRYLIRYPIHWSDMTLALALALLALLPIASAAQDNLASDAGAEKRVASTVASCAACHGATGAGNPAGGFQRLAGLHPAYIAAQLAHFANGTRQSPIMSPIAKPLTLAERDAVASYFGKQQGAGPVLSADDDKMKSTDTGAWLANHGRWDDNLPACSQCHGPGGIGVGAAFPALTGQTSTYL
ncbi:MAG: c-type cytochrome, partial [Pseudomonadota bacterium]|nr:c-type cytochrome [Pseudomonadota bacterium]